MDNEKIIAGIVAILKEQAVIKAETRALRDLLIQAGGKTEKHRDELFNYWAAQAESYYDVSEKSALKLVQNAQIAIQNMPEPSESKKGKK
ncbi:MAG TPA: hypothetical protein VGR14_19785 [Verrucomicrobiae bacterium]|jgi:hypothetical protein|nr:hypothetical protein [Verrucomicrobiae bacterium]